MIDLLGAKMPEIPDTPHGLMQLRQRHVNLIGILADCDWLSMDQMRTQLIEHYEYFFGPLRLQSPAVPSDEFRKAWVVMSVCDLIQARWLERYKMLIEGPGHSS